MSNGFEPVSANETGEARLPGAAQGLDAVYNIPVQVSAVLGRATLQVSQLPTDRRLVQTRQLPQLGGRGRAAGLQLRQHRVAHVGQVRVQPLGRRSATPGQVDQLAHDASRDDRTA